MQEEKVQNTQTEATSADEQKETVQAETNVETEQDNEEYNQETKAEVDEKDEKIAELQNRILRLQADFDNFRRRSTNEKQQLSIFVTADVVSKFLKVLDNFERAEASVAKNAEVDTLIAGLKQIRRQFEDTFKELGVVEIEAQNKKFDPNFHEAVMRGNNPEMEDETIDMVFEKGYKLQDKVIRHSKVRVISND